MAIITGRGTEEGNKNKKLPATFAQWETLFIAGMLYQKPKITIID